MGLEGEPLNTIDSLKQKQDKLHQVIAERGGLYERIGTGEIDPLSSAENAIKVGRVKENIQRNTQVKERKLFEIDDQMLNIQAEGFINEREKRRDDLDQIRYFAEEGHLGADVLAHYEEDFTNFIDSVNSIPGLSERVKDFEEDKEKPNSGDMDNIKIVYRRMAEFIEGLPNRKNDRGEIITSSSRKWKKTWSANLDKYGDESLYSIFPKELAKNPALITRTLNAMKGRRIKEDISISTKSELVALTITSDMVLLKRNLGEKGLSLMRLMQDVVRVERGIPIENQDKQD